MNISLLISPLLVIHASSRTRLVFFYIFVLPESRAPHGVSIHQFIVSFMNFNKVCCQYEKYAHHPHVTVHLKVNKLANGVTNKGSNNSLITERFCETIKSQSGKLLTS